MFIKCSKLVNNLKITTYFLHPTKIESTEKYGTKVGKMGNCAKKKSYDVNIISVKKLLLFFFQIVPMLGAFFNFLSFFCR